jgi:hypothetical protein
LVLKIERGETRDLDSEIFALRRAAPNSTMPPVPEAAAAMRECDYPAVQRALATLLPPSPVQRGLPP